MAAQELAVFSGIRSFLRSVWHAAVGYGKGCATRQAVSEALEETERGVDRRVTVTMTVGQQDTLQQDVHDGAQTGLTGRVTAHQYDWPAQSSVASTNASARGLASLPAELAALLERAGLPPPVSVAEAGDEACSPPPTGSMATTTEWLYIVTFSVQVLDVACSSKIEDAIAQLEHAALDPKSAEAVAGLVSILCDGPADDSDVIHVRALLCANETAASELRENRTGDITRKKEMHTRHTEDNEQDALEPFPLDRVLGATHGGPVLPDVENASSSTVIQDNHFITNGTGPPWPCMPGCSCATRDRTAARAETDQAAEGDVAKKVLGSITWSLPEDLTMLLQGDGPLLDRIQAKLRASLALAHAWWLHSDGQATTRNNDPASASMNGSNTQNSDHDTQGFRRWMQLASAAAASLRTSTSTTTKLHFASMRLIFDKLRAVAAAHDASTYWTGAAARPWGSVAVDGSWATAAAQHQVWDILSLSGGELGHRIRSKLLQWCGGLLGHPQSLSSAVLAVYNAIVLDAYALTSTELWVVKLECAARSGSEALSDDGHGKTSARGNEAGSNHRDGSHGILRTSTLGSAVQIRADLKGCTVPAWLPLTVSQQRVPVPATQPKADWESQADWSGESSMHDSTDLWSADVPGERSLQ